MILPIVIGIRTGRWLDAAQCAVLLLAIMAFFCVIVSGNKLVVDDESIAYRIGFKPMRRMYFRNIAASVPIIVAESEWPVTLAIYETNARWPSMWVPLKPWRQTDVKWLLTLPELKLEEPVRSLTKRGVERILQRRNV